MRDHFLRELWRTLSLLALLSLGFAAQAHECRPLGPWYRTPPVTPSYGICTGFAREDAEKGLPGAGKRNNLDFFPAWIYSDNNVSWLDTSKGDTVDITATLSYLNDTVYEVPFDEEGNIAVPFFFQFQTVGVGYDSPVALDKTGKPLFQRTFTEFVEVPLPDEGLITYRIPKDFILPYRGMYSWVISGTLHKKGHPAVHFDTKFTCQQPQVPYGPWDASNIRETQVPAPEGWFDCVRYPTPAPLAAGAPTRSSPRAVDVLRRLGLNLN